MIKRRFLLYILAAAMLIVLTFAFVGCGKDVRGYAAAENGVYYLYENSKHDDKDTITLNNGRWKGYTELDGLKITVSGSYKIKDGTVSLTAKKGDQEVSIDYEIKNGVMKGGGDYYCKIDRVPSSFNMTDEDIRELDTGKRMPEGRYYLRDYITGEKSAKGEFISISGKKLHCSAYSATAEYAMDKGKWNVGFGEGKTLVGKYSDGVITVLNNCGYSYYVRDFKTLTHKAVSNLSGYEYTDAPGGYAITAVKDKTKTSYSLPDNVVAVGADAFSNCNDATQIKFKKLKYIGDGAFKGCTSLESISLKNVAEISDNAFADCKKLASAEMPERVDVLGKSAFSNCSSLTHIKLPKNITSIPDGLFISCSKLQTVELPAGLKEIGANAFAYCTALSFELPDTLETIGSGAFRYCTFTEVVIPDSVTQIGDDAFRYSKAQSVVFGAGITQANGFSNCTELTTVTFGANTKSICNYAFAGCEKLTDIVIPEGVTDICYAAFTNCVINSITLPDSLEHISEDAFAFTAINEVITIGKGLREVNKYAFYSCRIKKVRYHGTAKKWSQIAIGDGNYSLTSANREYF